MLNVERGMLNVGRTAAILAALIGLSSCTTADRVAYKHWKASPPVFKPVEEGAFENGLENVEEGLGFLVEAVPEAFFGLVENVVEIGPDEGVGTATQDRDEEGVAAGPHEGDPTIREIEAGLDVAVGVEELGHEGRDSALDPALGGVADRIVTGVGDQGVGILAQQEGFLDLVATGAIEDDLVVGAGTE